MAKITSSDTLKYRGFVSPEKLRAAEEKALEEACEIAIDAVKKSIRAEDVWDTGAMYASVKAGETVVTDDGLKKEVWPMGYRVDENHKKKVANELIANVAEYGRHGGYGFGGKANDIKGKAFMVKAKNAVEDRVAAKVLEVLERELGG